MNLLRYDVQLAGLENEFMRQVVSEAASLPNFEVSQATLKITKKKSLPLKREFVISFTERNLVQFPAISFSLIQKNEKVYASTGPDIKNLFMHFNSQGKTHKDLENYFRNLSAQGGFKVSDCIKTGEHFPTSWIRLG